MTRGPQPSPTRTPLSNPELQSMPSSVAIGNQQDYRSPRAHLLYQKTRHNLKWSLEETQEQAAQDLTIFPMHLSPTHVATRTGGRAGFQPRHKCRAEGTGVATTNPIWPDSPTGGFVVGFLGGSTAFRPLRKRTASEDGLLAPEKFSPAPERGRLMISGLEDIARAGPSQNYPVELLYQCRTRRERSVFQRLASPTPVSISNGICSG